MADSRWRSFPLRGPLPFSGANAAFGYLPLQHALQIDVRKLKLVRGKAGFADKMGEYADLSGKWLNFRTTVSDKFGFYRREIVVGSGYSSEQNYEYMFANIAPFEIQKKVNNSIGIVLSWA